MIESSCSSSEDSVVAIQPITIHHSITVIDDTPDVSEDEGQEVVPAADDSRLESRHHIVSPVKFKSRKSIAKVNESVLVSSDDEDDLEDPDTRLGDSGTGSSGQEFADAYGDIIPSSAFAFTEVLEREADEVEQILASKNRRRSAVHSFLSRNLLEEEETEGTTSESEECGSGFEQESDDSSNIDSNEEVVTIKRNTAPRINRDSVSDVLAEDSMLEERGAESLDQSADVSQVVKSAGRMKNLRYIIDSDSDD